MISKFEETGEYGNIPGTRGRCPLNPEAYIQTAHHLSPRLAISEIGQPDKRAAPCPSGLSRRAYSVTLQTFLKEIRLNKVRCLMELRSKTCEKNKRKRCSF